MEALKEMLGWWFTAQCEFNFVLAEKLRGATKEDFPALLPLQQMRTTPTWLVKKAIDFDGVCSGSYVDAHLAVSHRWELPGDPDPEGTQLASLKAFLNANPQIQFVFYDFPCLPQGKDKTPAEKAEFQTILSNVNMIYLGSTVLIMADTDYMRRFWTNFEAWLSFVTPSPAGLVGTSGKVRCSFDYVERGLAETIRVKMQGALEEGLREKLCKPVEEVHAFLESDTIQVTNKSDKAIQLPKIFSFNEAVIGFMRRKAAAKVAAEVATSRPSSARRGLPPPPPQASSAAAAAAGTTPATSTAPQETLMSQVARIKEALALDASLPPPVAIKQANEMMDIKPEGLPAQASKLLAAIGI